jgi:hypothetical protein
MPVSGWRTSPSRPLESSQIKINYDGLLREHGFEADVTWVLVVRAEEDGEGVGVEGKQVSFLEFADEANAMFEPASGGRWRPGVRSRDAE